MKTNSNYYDTIEDYSYGEFENAVHDFISDRNADEYVDDPLTLLPMEEGEKANDSGEWQAFAEDSEHIYAMNAFRGDIIISCIGDK